MSNFSLSDPKSTAPILDQIFLDQEECQILVSEDKCFKDKGFLSLGSVSRPHFDEAAFNGYTFDNSCAFEWKTPNIERFQKDLIAALEIPVDAKDNQTKAAAEKDMGRLDRILDSIASVGVRLGMVHPCLDADILSELPFRRPVSIVSDTSAISQGALDFIARFTHPAARIKIPAIVHMEIVNQADRFFSLRRGGKNSRAATLLEHVLSQGAQRVLLRLELHSDAEIERTAVLSDPLRNAFQAEKDIPNSNLSAPVRSYCDRLILEVARQHQAYSAPGHQVYLLTSDQGMARMAISEGIVPIFYEATCASHFFNKTLSGVGLNPFSGGITKAPLTSVLWELAATFGKARLARTDGSMYVDVAAIGDNLTWSPFHSREDLLWVASSPAPAPAEQRQRPEEEPHARTSGKAELALPSLTGEILSAQIIEPQKSHIALPAVSSSSEGYFRFSTEKFIEIVCALAAQSGDRRDRLEGLLADQSPRTIKDYQRLLESGGLIEATPKGWQTTDALLGLSDALHALDFDSIKKYFLLIPSFRNYSELLSVGKPLPRDSGQIPTRVFPGYTILAEISCAACSIADEGVYATESNPPAKKFADLAIERFLALAGNEDYVAVGAWLEDIVRSFGIHPVRARNRLLEAHQRNLIVLHTEGSTTDTKYDRHAVRVLTLERGKPQISISHLYRGDFLIQGKSSTSMHLERNTR